jgi:hypothetical protein
MKRHRPSLAITPRMNTLFEPPASDANKPGGAKNASVKGNARPPGMTWTPLPFGKNKGKTLPQVICSDPSWFLWAIRDNILKYRHAHEGAILYRRIQAIMIPKQRPQKWAVEHRFDRDGRYEGFYIVRKNEHPHSKYNSRSPCLDLTLVDARRKREWRRLTRDLRRYYFGGKKMTKIRCGQFFRDESHFVNP